MACLTFQRVEVIMKVPQPIVSTKVSFPWSAVTNKSLLPAHYMCVYISHVVKLLVLVVSREIEGENALCVAVLSDSYTALQNLLKSTIIIIISSSSSSILPAGLPDCNDTQAGTLISR